ncbi:2-octaprenyl-6-methoxyphenyl hydroxylase [Xaviernesmea oryzae]|uniref:2-octaprenyl-6-methoxyphenyl hydroxylase n=1 Tax=Xaviernesmea oryzae TaxID=464029 RepID=A0A1Q9AXE9_9HYPH|nr:UbiH/UbiF family hydroxylase [Xaviernesmea oryzae]OLP60101.1 2-octaprenyl-6-methoxyphenyl hydroxylase [Xaviernesmea oryzae]SEK51029.1 2-octaprenyl-6-methoxyphenol hydroxylase [Xaviernesmea oryzae]
MQDFEIAVVGAGLAGALAALGLAASGRSVALIGPPPATTDGRTTALMDRSIAFVRSLGLWEDGLADLAAPLSTMRIIDDTGRLLRAPTVTFHAADIGLYAFGYNMPNAGMLAMLEERIAATPGLARFATVVETIEETQEGRRLTLGDGTRLSARLLVGADGRGSKVRAAAGIEAKTWSYPQTAVVLNLVHELPHQSISTEFHTAEGPFTQVPLPGLRSSLVWVRRPDKASVLIAMAPEGLSRAVEDGMGSLLGKVIVDGLPQAFPLSGMQAKQVGKGRTVLLGEAAHAFPPIGAQGLNLSLRDVATVVEMLAPAGPIAADFGERYAAKRKLDISTRTISVDLLNRSLLSDFMPVQLLRAGGLQALSSAGMLRNLVMREGVHPGSALGAMADSLKPGFLNKV